MGFSALVIGICIGAYMSVESFIISQAPGWEANFGFYLIPTAFISGIGTIFLIIGLFYKYRFGWISAIILGALYLLSLIYFWLKDLVVFDPLLLSLLMPGIFCIIAGGLFKLSLFLRQKKVVKS
jgi:hypothetical protein